MNYSPSWTRYVGCPSCRNIYSIVGHIGCFKDSYSKCYACPWCNLGIEGIFPSDTERFKALHLGRILIPHNAFLVDSAQKKPS